MNVDKISTFMLERYRLGELSPGEYQEITGILSSDNSLRSRMEELDESDRELRLRYPAINLNPDSIKPAERRFIKHKTGNHPVRFTRIAAIILACILLPVIYFLRTGPGSSAGRIVQNDLTAPAGVSNSGETQDRAKGLVSENSGLSIYLKGNGEILLSDQAVLQEGNTVQLAYTAPAGEHYGVIFSIDGRSTVTMHYPYRKGQSSILVPGKRTFLDEAYTLDDAPDYEVFIMVISERPLSAEEVILEAQKIAEEPPAPGRIEEKTRNVFEGCEVETVTILKE